MEDIHQHLVKFYRVVFVIFAREADQGGNADLGTIHHRVQEAMVHADISGRRSFEQLLRWNVRQPLRIKNKIFHGRGAGAFACQLLRCAPVTRRRPSPRAP